MYDFVSEKGERMAGTMLDYIMEYGDYTFAEKPLNEVDSLVLCQFAYLKLDGIVPLVTENKKSVNLQYIFDHADFEKLFADTRFEKENRELFLAMLASKRFRSIKLNCYINIVEPEWETQFSAVTFILNDGIFYLAYRGTDETIVGWKEDFNMAFLDPVPGQDFAMKYINMVTGKLRQKFYVGGHSKGGNFAVYAALNCVKSVQDRIIYVYNHDGPGFRPEVMARLDYKALENRVLRILPHSSLVGILFSHTDSTYQVVESKTFGLLQHDPFTWLVEDNHFVKVKDIYKARKFSGNTLNEWILSLNEEQVRLFVETLYTIISASEAVTLIDFTSDWKKSMMGVIAAAKEVDEETREILKTTVKTLFDMAKERMKMELNPKNLIEEFYDQDKNS